MQLASNMWIEGAYYVDFDVLGQLRIVGPNNHLHYASVGVPRELLEITSTYSERGQFVLEGKFLTDKMFLHDPAIGHIKRVRDLTEIPGKPQPSFESIYKRYPTDLAPNYIGVEDTDRGYEISYKRLFQNHWYGAKLLFAPGVSVHRHDRRRGYNLKTSLSEIHFKLTTDADELPDSKLAHVIGPDPLATAKFGADKDTINHLLDRTMFEITHLVKNNKTSGFDYGTVFPRDWMESADLGLGDLTPETVAYMYHRAYEFVNPQGLGWHENIVGEFEYEKEEEARELSQSLDDLVDQSNRVGHSLRELVSQITEMYIIRNMVDIEPRYLFALNSVDPKLLSAQDIDRAKRVAKFITLQASTNQLITFKKIPRLMRRHKYDVYYSAGNWRDSETAFRRVHEVIAPYDVNVVFYPRALEIISRHARALGADRTEIKELMAKWQRPREWYKFKNNDGKLAYALALYNIHGQGTEPKFKRLEVNHLDEAYDLFYGQPSRSDVISFAQRMASPDYFWTKSGPTIVGAGDGYTTRQYHGRVIWTKQTAFAVAGLARQLKRARNEGWPGSAQQLLTKTITQTAYASIRAWLQLGSVPELHYDKAGAAHFYNDQPTAEGPMNLVQLWSAVGARAIIKTYLETELGYPQPPIKSRSTASRNR